MDCIISPSSSLTPSHAMSSGLTTRLPQNLRRQQDCHLGHVHYPKSSDGYAINQSEVPVCILSPSANSIPLPLVAYLHGTGRVDLPSYNVAENGTLSAVPPSFDRVLTAVPRHQDTAWSSQYDQANYPASTSSAIYAAEDGYSTLNHPYYSYNGAYTATYRPIQLPHHPIPIPITQAHTSFLSDSADMLLVDAIPPHYAQDMSPRSVQYSSGYTRDNGNALTFGEPTFVHRAPTGATGGLASTPVPRSYIAPLRGWANDHERTNGHDNTSGPYLNVSSWLAPPNLVMPPLQGLCPSGHMDSESVPTPLEWTASPPSFTSEPFPHPNKPTEITPGMPHNLLYTLPAPSQANSHAEVITLHAPPRMVPPPNPPPPSPSEMYPHNSSSYNGNGSLSIPSVPLVADHPPTEFEIDPLEAIRDRGRARSLYRTKTKKSPASELISTRCAGYIAKNQSRSRVRPSAVHRLCDRKVRARCGWINEDGSPCGAPITYANCADHFAIVHGIKDKAADVKVHCRWCTSPVEKKIKRKNILRHLREVHLRCSRSKWQDS
ncbi:hypothetical protein EDC04DRAFT_945476 [Pisolithus marmoratus]|nr:hypothetical protein EDC04DRAFT_945476 [Pisolithus marmoratus]